MRSPSHRLTNSSTLLTSWSSAVSDGMRNIPYVRIPNVAASFRGVFTTNEEEGRGDREVREEEEGREREGSGDLVPRS